MIQDISEDIFLTWRVDGKVKTVKQSDNKQGEFSLSFDYKRPRERAKEECFAHKQNSAGEMGQRPEFLGSETIAKHAYDKQGAANDGLGNLVKTTYYVLDATGNVMSVYEREVDASAASITFEQAERHIYGSSRLGVMNASVPLLGTQNDIYSQTSWIHTIGQRTYELSNHLGNVLSVISDKIIPHNNGGNVDYYMADIVQSTDYSAFHAPLNERTLYKSNSTFDYRYGGSNGQEKVDEISGNGNHYTAEYWEYDSRLGRRWNIDPVVKHHESPYACFANNPIWFLDPNGADTTLDESTRAIIKDITDATSVNYNEAFTKDFQRLVDDKTTVYSFKQWDKAEKSEGQVLYGVASGAGVDSEGRNLVSIEYTLQTSPSGHKLEAFFEEFDHGLQFLDQRIGYLVPDASTPNGRGPAFGYDYYDEVDNKIARVKYISAFKDGSSYKVQLFGINAKIVKSNFTRTTVEKYVDMNYSFTNKEELNAFQALSKASDYTEQELRDAFNSGQRWAEFLIGAGK